MARNEKGQFAKSQPASEVSKASGRTKGTRMNSVPAGETGLKRSMGNVTEEFLPELKGKNAAKVYKEMRDNDPIVGAMFFAIEMYLRRVKWFIDPATEDEKGQADAKFLRECKEDMSHTWSDFIAEVMSMMEHGWAYLETLYKPRTTDAKKNSDEPQSLFNDGKIGWRKFETRAQDSLDKWEFDEEGGLAGMWQLTNGYERKFVPIQKSLLFRTSVKKNNPEGRSVLRNAYRPWYFKKRIEEIEGVGIERDLAGLPFAEVPAEMLRDDASDADKETLASIIELVKNVRRDEQEGVIWPQSFDENGNAMYKFSLMNSGGTRAFSTDTTIVRYEGRMAMVILADFILLGADQGSNASIGATTTKSGLFQSSLGAWLDVIQDVLNLYAVPRLMRLNGIEGPYPKFRHDEVQKPSLADLATFVAALAGAGAQLFPDIELENHFRDQAQLPLREAKEEDKTKEDDLRNKKVDADVAAAEEAIKNPGGPPPAAPLGKDPKTKPGAPTKTTGKVKSKLPPQSRRRTAAVNASENVSKRRVVRRIKK